MQNYRIFYRPFGNKGRINQVNVLAKSQKKAVTQVQNQNPRGQVLAAFLLDDKEAV